MKEIEIKSSKYRLLELLEYKDYLDYVKEEIS